MYLGMAPMRRQHRKRKRYVHNKAHANLKKENIINEDTADRKGKKKKGKAYSVMAIHHSVFDSLGIGHQLNLII
jgi:hypothetical protein